METTQTKTVNGVTYKVHTDLVHLYGKIHHAHPTRYTRNNGGERVAHPLCGQRSRRFYPSHPVSNETFEVDCAKCLNIKAQETPS